MAFLSLALSPVLILFHSSLTFSSPSLCFSLLFHLPGKKQEKNRKRGRNKISAKLRRKQKNVVDAQSIKLKEAQKAEQEKRRSAAAAAAGAGGTGAAGSDTKKSNLGALQRFAAKS